MRIRLVIAETDDGLYEVVDAWDEYTLDYNPEGYEERLKKARKTFGGAHVREVDVALPVGAIAAAFGVPVVEAKAVRDE